MYGTHEISREMERLNRLFEQEWRSSKTMVADLLGENNARLDGTRCTLLNSMNELLHLVQQSHHAPMSQHKQAVKRVLMDHDFVAFQTGDIHGRFDEQNTSRIDQLSSELVELLEKVRQKAISTGNWSDRLNPLEFFG
ncbi:hypothetical protein JD969_06445 [Planctomycetota bacterium]|nr:hypothetical protein JD969_06445 [Planctomycetota bacterium]